MVLIINPKHIYTNSDKEKANDILSFICTIFLYLFHILYLFNNPQFNIIYFILILFTLMFSWNVYTFFNMDFELEKKKELADLYTYNKYLLRKTLR